ncbi:MAG TPA: hypothetical protein VL832_28125 [Puia sp.]|jgi:hypothetical protein|nr:hypothetical protein [Puia sp.]
MTKEEKQQLKYHAERIEVLAHDRAKNVYETVGGIQFHIKQINEILEKIKITKS